MSILYIAKNGRFILDLSGNNHVVCTAPTVRIQDARALFAVAPGEQEKVERACLLAAAKDLLSKVEADFDRLQYSYSFRDEVYGAGGSGTTGGIRSNGKIYSLEGGRGTCLLEETGIGPTGKGYVVGQTDVRSEKAIQTENMGRITITKRKKPLTIHLQLKKFIAFLEEQPDQYLVKTLYEGETRPMDLVRELEGGEGLEEDWIKERLHAFGDEAIRELVDCYGQSKYSKYRWAIEHILAHYYTSVATWPYVEGILAGKLRPKQRQLYLGLLEALKGSEGLPS